MAARTDQLQSHQFVMTRLVSALALREANPGPSRRIWSALIAGALVTALAMGGVAVHAVLRPGSDQSWRSGKAIIIERESGARYLLRGGLLHPVLNDASALLLLGSAAPARVLVPRARLASVPRGRPLGIPGAPDPLPATGDLLTGAWSVCSRTVTASAAGATGTAITGRDAGPFGGAESLLWLGAGEPGTAIADRALLAADARGGLQVIWHGVRFPVSDEKVVLAAFAWSRSAAQPLATAVLNAIPGGADLDRITIAGAGGASPVLGLRVGSVVAVANQSGGQQFGVALRDGIAEITEVQANLMLASGANAPMPGPRQLSQAEYAAAARAGSLIPTGPHAPPAKTPILAGPAEGVCVSYSGPGAPQVRLSPVRPSSPDEVRAIDVTASSPSDRAALVVGAAVADFVAIPAGHGALVEALATPQASTGALAIVSDLGARYPIPNEQVLKTLGYGGAPVLKLPAALVALLPEGRALDPAAAWAA